MYAVNWSILIFAFQLILPIFGITYNFSFHWTLKVHKRSSLLSSLVNKRVDKCTRVYFIHACYHQHFCKLRLNPLELPLGQNHLYLSLFMFSTEARFFFFYLFGFRIDLQYIIGSFPLLLELPISIILIIPKKPIVSIMNFYGTSILLMKKVLAHHVTTTIILNPPSVVVSLNLPHKKCCPIICPGRRLDDLICSLLFYNKNNTCKIGRFF